MRKRSAALCAAIALVVAWPVGGRRPPARTGRATMSGGWTRSPCRRASGAFAGEPGDPSGRGSRPGPGIANLTLTGEL